MYQYLLVFSHETILALPLNSKIAAPQQQTISHRRYFAMVVILRRAATSHLTTKTRLLMAACQGDIAGIDCSVVVAALTPHRSISRPQLHSKRHNYAGVHFKT